MHYCPSAKKRLAMRQDNAELQDDTCILEQCGKTQCILMVLHSSDARKQIPFVVCFSTSEF